MCGVLRVVVMLGVGIGRNRGGYGPFRGRFDHVESELILRSEVRDQRDRDEPCGKTQTAESREHHDANLRARHRRRKRANFLCRLDI